MIEKKGACLALAAVTVAGLLAGCSSGSSDSSTTVTFAGQTQEKDIWDAQFKAFEQAHPDIKVDAQYTPNDSYPQLMQTQLQAGNAADVIQTTPGTGGGLPALTLAAGGRLADLTDMSWVGSMPPSSKPLVTLDGKVHAYPTDVAPLFVAYNPQLFSSAGLSAPTTFAQLTEACTKLAGAGVTPISLAGASYQNTSILVQAIAANNVFGPDPDWNTERKGNSTTFASTAGWQKTVSDIRKMIDAKCFASDVAAVKAPVHMQRFAASKAAMYVMPAQAINSVRNAAPDLKFSSFAFPADTAAQTRVSAASGIALVVNAKARNSDAARKLIDFMSTPAQRAAYANTAGTIAPGAGPDGSDVYTEVLTPLKPYMAPDKVLTLNYLSWPNANVAQQLATSVQGLFTGQKSAEQVLADADQAWNTANK